MNLALKIPLGRRERSDNVTADGRPERPIALRKVAPDRSRTRYTTVPVLNRLVAYISSESAIANGMRS